MQTAYGDGKAAVRYAIDQELREAPQEAILAAALSEPGQIAEIMDVHQSIAREVRRAARKHLIDQWKFEDAAWERT